MLSLPIEGILVHHEMKCKQHSTIDIDTKGSALGYTRFMQTYKKHSDEAITFEEETCFYLLWLCKFLINSSSKRFVTFLALIPTDTLLNIVLFGLRNPQGFVPGLDLPSCWAQPSTGLLTPEHVPHV